MQNSWIFENNAYEILKFSTAIPKGPCTRENSTPFLSHFFPFLRRKQVNSNNMTIHNCNTLVLKVPNYLINCHNVCFLLFSSKKRIKMGKKRRGIFSCTRALSGHSFLFLLSSFLLWVNLLMTMESFTFTSFSEMAGERRYLLYPARH